MDKRHYDELFDRLLEGKLSAEETEDLLKWIQREENRSEVSDSILSAFQQTASSQEVSPEIRQRLQARLPLIIQEGNARRDLRTNIVRQSWFRFAAAAILIGIVGFSVYKFLPQSSDNVKVPVTANIASTDIAPGHEGAVLTLADGRKILLDSLGNGIIASSEGAEVKLSDGQLIYDNVSDNATASYYNTISTPKGRFFQIVLPDQTKVWLNAASSLRYPTAFAANERRVEIDGEAYFEVAKNPAAPFIVKVNDETTVRVLGTHFNINAYTNEEEIRTTLLEGSVQVSGKSNLATIKPGQQAKISRNSDNTVRIAESVNIDKVMAWKNGSFNFEDATLEEVMHQLERWYDIDVVYEQGVPKIEFVGKMGRDLSLKSVLRGLELSKVRFKLEGRKLLVLP
ncbi:FecR domain-containing protein [Terrimonas sp. NA20]|uniref:FecR domain-containing protein n=1 Tax=Terrimonas ginsenosidimutans TaxID=2908004 RepID=A0ABS9KLZ8_9BACT|nr:FecR domain-containing protein [Terrimonas ginsenosidimutans]